MTHIKVLIADDQAEVRQGMAMMMSAEPDMEVVGEAEDGQQAVAMAQTLCPHVVLMDIRMPGIDGIEATRRVTHERLGDCSEITSVLVLTTFDQDDLIYGALRAGASGYMLKEAAPANLTTAIRKVAQGGWWIDPSVAGTVISTLRDTAPVDASGRPSLEMLSRREIEVLRLMADAPTNIELAAKLFVSEATVKTHISRMLMKTGSHERAQLVALAYRSGLVRP